MKTQIFILFCLFAIVTQGQNYLDITNDLVYGEEVVTENIFFSYENSKYKFISENVEQEEISYRLFMPEGDTFSIEINTGRKTNSFKFLASKDTIFNIFNNEELKYTKRPTVFFYPNENMELTVKDERLNINHFTVDTMGYLTNIEDSLRYKYLEFDNMSADDFDVYFSTGFVVKKYESEEFLDFILTRIGLKNSAKIDFIDYSLPLLYEHRYNAIHFVFEDECDSLFQLETSTQPENIFKFYMIFTGLNEEMKIKEQIIEPRLNAENQLFVCGGFMLNNLEAWEMKKVKQKKKKKSTQYRFD
jgi:hypothetical protein